MAIQVVKAEEFDEVTKEGIWIADFYTTHCGPCKALDVILEGIIFDMPMINMAKCNLDYSPEYSERFDIKATPTLFFMNDGKIVDRTVGLMDRSKLEEYIQKCIYSE